MVAVPASSALNLETDPLFLEDFIPIPKVSGNANQHAVLITEVAERHNSYGETLADG